MCTDACFHETAQLTLISNAVTLSPNLSYIPVVALYALVLLGLLDDDDLINATLAGGSDGAEVQHLQDNTRNAIIYVRHTNHTLYIQAPRGTTR